MIMIPSKSKTGYMVSYEYRDGGFLHGRHFPDKHAGEALFPSEGVAWVMAATFAARTDPNKYVNIYVIGSDFRPVPGYEEKVINRYPAKQNA